MSIRHPRWSMPGLAATFLTLALATTAAQAAPKAVQRPIQDFLEAQGTLCIDDGAGGCFLFVPPDPNFLGWTSYLDEDSLYFAGVDYAALAPEAYGSGAQPVITGTVTERPLKDGTAEVSVNLHAQGVNAWVIDLDLNGDVLDQIANKPTLFGARPRDVALDPTTQALADVHLRAVFINTAPGAPLPDLLNFTALGAPGLKMLAISTTAKGPLTEEFGVGMAGTPGQATIVQTGLFATSGKAAPGSAVADGFPAEIINLRAVGQ